MIEEDIAVALFSFARSGRLKRSCHTRIVARVI